MEANKASGPSIRPSGGETDDATVARPPPQKASPFTMKPSLPPQRPNQNPDVIFREGLDFEKKIIRGDVTNKATNQQPF